MTGSEASRQAILANAVKLATVDGLDGLSIGNLASSLGMSKSGLYAHFGSKEELQLATVETAYAGFRTDVVDVARAAEPGVPRLMAFVGAFFEQLRGDDLPGGCFIAGAALEMSAKPGRVKEQIVLFQNEFVSLIEEYLAEAVEHGDLRKDVDVPAFAFEVHGILLAANSAYALSGDHTRLDFANGLISRRLDELAA